MKSLRVIFGFKTKEEKIKEYEEVKKALDNIAQAKTFDELGSITLPSSGLIIMSTALLLRATDIRFESLEKRVSELELWKTYLEKKGIR